MGQTKTKGLRIATRCTTIEQFVAAFHRFCDAQTFFISTLSTRPVGLETAFSIELANNTPALRGIGVVVEAWATSKNPFGRPGLQLGIRRLTSDSEPVFEKLLRAQEATVPNVAPVLPPPLATVLVRAQTPRPATASITIVEPAFGGPAPDANATEAPRTPGSELVLPANPLMNLTDESLEGFVDCTLYEETANFFPIDPPTEDPNDPVAPPPRHSTEAMIAIASPLELASPAGAAAHGPTVAAGTTPPPTIAASLPSLVPSRIPPIGAAPTPASVIAASLANATATIAANASANPGAGVGTLGKQPAVSTTTFFGHAPAATTPTPPIAPNSFATALASAVAPQPRSIATPPPLPVVLDRGATDSIELDPDSVSTVVRDGESMTEHRPSLDNMLSGMQAPDVWPAGAPHANPQHVPARPADDDGFDLPPSRWRTLRARGVELVTGPRRWWVVGGTAAATLTIAIALVLASRSTSSAKTGDGSHELVAANDPNGALPGDHARISKPITDARATKNDQAPTDDDGAAAQVGDNGAAPVVGTGPCKIAVSTTPAGSIITVDGEQAGPSPITIGGPCKPRKIDIAHPRYQTTTRLVTGKPATEPLEVSLARPTHDLYVETQPSGATISIDGHRAGTSPTIVKIMGFTTLNVTIEKPGFKAQSKKIYSKTPHDKQSIKLVQNGRGGAINDLVRAKL